ncbi:MAG: hypothetical protein RL144_501 [Actinomycetota bacterium]
MKKLALLFSFLTLVISGVFSGIVLAPQAHAANEVIRITSPLNQSFTGEFRDGSMAQLLLPSGELGQLVFRSMSKERTWVIDPALIDAITAMTSDYKVLSDEEPTAGDVALSWLDRLKAVTARNEVISLPYGNPDIELAKILAPSELALYLSFGKTRLESLLGRTVTADNSHSWSEGKSRLSFTERKTYGENRRALTRLSRVVAADELSNLRARLAQLLSPNLDRESREFFTLNATQAVNEVVDKLRINSGNYQVTTSSVKLPVTVINDFDTEVVVDVSMIPINSRMVVESFKDVVIAPASKIQLEMGVEVIAPGETVVSAYITDKEGVEVVPEALLTLNSSVIDVRVAWFTTGAAILLLLAGVAQSVRRVRKKSK